MLQNALAGSLPIYAFLLGVVLKECVFLAPHRDHIWTQYGQAFIWLSLLLIGNIFAAVYAFLRKLSLKDTGDKLAHLEKQLRGRATISEELTERILERHE